MSNTPCSWKPLLLLFLSIGSVYALMARGSHGSVDEIFIYRTTESLVRNHSLTIEAIGDRTVSRFSVLPSLWGAPFFALGDLVLPDGRERSGWLLYTTQLSSCVATAVAAVLLAAWLCRLGCDVTVSVTAAYLYALTSLAFPYSGTLFIQIVTTPILVWLCFSAAVGSIASAVLAAALLVACRLEAAVLVVAVATAVAFEGFRTYGRTILALGIGAMTGVTLGLGNNWLRGDPLFAGAYAGEAFSTSLWVGLASVTTSIGKGLLWFAPLCMIGCVATPWYAWRRPNPGRIVAFVIVAQFVLVAKWWTWHGGLIAGPRLLLPILPLCMLPVAEWLTGWHQHPRVLRKLFACTALAGLVSAGWLAIRPLNEFPLRDANEAETIYIPQASVFAARLDWPTNWLWRPERSTADNVVAGALLLTFVGATGGLLLPVLRDVGWRNLEWKVPLAAILLTGAVHAPSVIDWAASGRSQFRHLDALPAGEGYRGVLTVPLTGGYLFSNPSGSVDVLLAGQPLFRETPTWISLQAGQYPIEIRYDPRQPAGELCWTGPGWGFYKQPIPADYLLSGTPDSWSRFRLSWRHFGWLLYLPAAFLGIVWLSSAGQQTGADRIRGPASA